MAGWQARTRQFVCQQAGHIVIIRKTDLHLPSFTLHISQSEGHTGNRGPACCPPIHPSTPKFSAFRPHYGRGILIHIHFQRAIHRKCDFCDSLRYLRSIFRVCFPRFGCLLPSESHNLLASLVPRRETAQIPVVEERAVHSGVQQSRISAGQMKTHTLTP